MSEDAITSKRTHQDIITLTFWWPLNAPQNINKHATMKGTETLLLTVVKIMQIVTARGGLIQSSGLADFSETTNTSRELVMQQNSVFVCVPCHWLTALSLHHCLTRIKLLVNLHQCCCEQKVTTTTRRDQIPLDAADKPRALMAILHIYFTTERQSSASTTVKKMMMSSFHHSDNN